MRDAGTRISCRMDGRRLVELMRDGAGAANAARDCDDDEENVSEEVKRAKRMKRREESAVAVVR